MIVTVKHIFALLTGRQRTGFILLQIASFVTALIQVTGVASIAPFIALMADPSLIHRQPLLRGIYVAVGSSSDVGFLTIVAVVIMLLILISNAAAAFTTWLMFVFSLRIGVELQSSIFRRYLLLDYAYFGATRSSLVTSLLTQEVPRYVYMVVQPFLTLTSQSLVVLIIVGGLLYLDPGLALLATAVVVGSYGLVYWLMKHRLVQHGQVIYDANSERVRILSESLLGIKEVKLLGLVGRYAEQFNQVNRRGLGSHAFIGLSADMPRFVIETIAFCALLLLAIILLRKSSDSSQVVSVLSLYAMAGFKLLPAAQAVYKATAQIKANGDVVNAFHDDVIAGRRMPQSLPSPSSSSGLQGEIQLEHVTFRYPDAQVDALTDVSLRIAPNSFVALVGPSGSGKSTLADLLLGLIEPTTGSVHIGGQPLCDANRGAWCRSIGYVPQDIFVINDTIRSNIAFGVSEHLVDDQRVIESAQLANLASVVAGLPGNYDFVVGDRGSRLSGGQRQRLGIARALYHSKDVLVLDEATSALDSESEREIASTVERLRSVKTIIVVAHRLTSIRAADAVVFLEAGRVQAVDTFDRLVATSRRFAEFVGN